MTPRINRFEFFYGDRIKVLWLVGRGQVCFRFQAHPFDDFTDITERQRGAAMYQCVELIFGRQENAGCRRVGSRYAAGDDLLDIEPFSEVFECDGLDRHVVIYISIHLIRIVALLLQ